MSATGPSSLSGAKPDSGVSPESALSEAITPEALDQLIFDAFVARSRAQLELVRGLRVLDETRFYLQLGYPSIHAYTERRFGVRRSEAYDWIRIARALDSLPKLEAAFADGEVGWTALKQVTRVATGETEAEWIAFVASSTTRGVYAEVKDALRNGRTKPRSDRFGLPNVTVRVAVEFSSDEHERFSKAIEKLAGEMSERCQGEPVEMKDVLLQLANVVIGSDPTASDPTTGEGAEAGTRTPIASNPYAVVYHLWPDGEGGVARAAMSTAAGPVEVEVDVVERVAGDAHTELIRAEDVSPEAEAEGEGEGEPAIDVPNSPQLRRRVLLRDGLTCSNPCCDRPAVHAHHLRFRSHGGRTAAWNETAVCAMCHALIHEGLLRVDGDPAKGLSWAPRARAPRAAVRHFERMQAATTYRWVRTGASVVESAPRSLNSCVAESTRVDSVDAAHDRELASGLVSVGFSLRQAKERIAFAREEVGAEASDEEVLRVALRSGKGASLASS